MALLLLTLGTTIAVWTAADRTSSPDPADWSALRFTLRQAVLSALISSLVAIPLARAIARRRFRGRGLVVSLMGAPFILPSIVAVLGIIAVWGRSGVISGVLETFGYNPLNIYGFYGVILAHVFFNLPLATRLILQGWQSIPQEHFRLAAQLDMSTSQIMRHLERPMLWTVLPSAFLLILLLCLSSFAVALALGGGPKATTVELAIYQALRFDFDLSKAAFLALVQFFLCVSFALVALFVTRPVELSLGLDREFQRWDGKETRFRIVDNFVMITAGLFLALPLCLIFVQGLSSLSKIPASVLPAIGASVGIALISTMICIFASLSLSFLVIRLAQHRKGASRAIELVGFLTLAASPFVMGTGLFILINPYFDPFQFAVPITAVVNAAMSLPFALRVILPALWRAEKNYGPLADSLGMERWKRFRYAILPRLYRAIGFAAGLTAALSIGDLGVIALFAAPEFETLPLLMYRLMSSYQMAAANGVALVLIAVSLSLFWLFDRGGRLDLNIR